MRGKGDQGVLSAIKGHTCMQPHSTILVSSHLSETGFVKKSLQPAAKAETRSLGWAEAVRATMMTELRKGDDGACSLEGDGVRMCSIVGVEGKMPIL